MKSKPLLSVILPTVNRNKYLVHTVQQVLDDKFKDLEVIVVDQSDEHDKDTIAYFADNKDPRLRFYTVAPISGVAAKNFGLIKARADIVVFLDDDILLEPDCLTMHYKAYKEHPDIGGTGGRVKQDGIQTTKELLKFNKYGLSGYNSFNYIGPAAYTDTVPGGNMSVKRDEAIRVGGFDTNFLRSQHREESEFSDRYHKAGNKFYFEPKACIVHLAAPYGGTRIKIDFADSHDFYKNNWYFVLRYVRWYNLPLAFIKQLRFYVLRKDIKLTLHQLVLFIWGLAVAIKRCILPIKTISHEVVND